jgi:acyl carrier protein
VIGDIIMINDDSNKLKDIANVSDDQRSSKANCSVSDLPAQTETSSIREYVAPRNEVEAGVAEILAEFLMTERVGINDNLLLLGGESLLAAQIAWQIQNRFGCEVTLRSILTGTVADIAAEIFAANGNPQV